LKAILFFYIPSTNIYKEFNNSLQLSTSSLTTTNNKLPQQPHLGIDYIDLYMRGILSLPSRPS
jgi:hypothetical protein